MANGTVIPANIQESRESASQLASEAGEFASQAPKIGEQLRQKSLAALNYNQDIVGPLDEASSAYFSAPQVGREKFQDIFNPFEREKLVSQYVGNQAIPMLGYSSILGQRMGTQQDFIGAGTGAYTAEANAKAVAAQLARQNYQDLLGEYQWGVEQSNKSGGGFGLNLPPGTVGNEDVWGTEWEGEFYEYTTPEELQDYFEREHEGGQQFATDKRREWSKTAVEPLKDDFSRRLNTLTIDDILSNLKGLDFWKNPVWL